MFGTDIALKHQVSEARFRDLLAEAERERSVNIALEGANADATSRHLRGAGDARHAAPPRGLLADAGRGAGCVQSSGCVRAPDRTVNAAVATETDAPGGQSARGIVLFSDGGVVSSDGVRTPAAASPACHVPDPRTCESGVAWPESSPSSTKKGAPPRRPARSTSRPHSPSAGGASSPSTWTRRRVSPWPRASISPRSTPRSMTCSSTIASICHRSRCQPRSRVSPSSHRIPTSPPPSSSCSTSSNGNASSSSDWSAAIFPPGTTY